MADERPVHAVFDCALGKQVEVPLTDEEWVAHKARMVEAAAESAAAAAADAELRARVAVHPDPLVRLLAERAGIA